MSITFLVLKDKDIQPICHKNQIYLATYSPCWTLMLISDVVTNREEGDKLKNIFFLRSSNIKFIKFNFSGENKKYIFQENNMEIYFYATLVCTVRRLNDYHSIVHFLSQWWQKIKILCLEVEVF